VIEPTWIQPDWPAPSPVKALSTSRHGGFSDGPWASLNLGVRGGDDADTVRRNRQRLAAELPAEPCWLHQVHGTHVVRHSGAVSSGSEPAADAIVAFAPGQVCAVLAADCLPVLFCDRAGSRVAAAHAGWRGLAAGVLESAVASLECEPGQLMAWLGPAIGPQVYEVGDEVAAAFPREREAALKRHGERWLLDLYMAARLKLAAAGIAAVYGGGFCTFSEAERFYSFRRDGETGRMASLIWLEG